MLPEETLDQLLILQFAVAWAGESGEDEPRLRWWKTDMVSPYGGHALFAQLTPRTAEWAALESVREAARRADQVARARAANPDELISLFHLGYDHDEQLNDRLRTHKQSGVSPAQALPRLGELLQRWDRRAFEEFLQQAQPPNTVNEPAGRRLTNAAPEDLAEAARRLARALVPLPEAYPCPHYRHA
jgi:hypothetical protein